MNTLIASSELERQIAGEPPGPIDAIEEYPCPRLSAGAYAIHTTCPPGKIFRRLNGYARRDETLYVIPLGRWAAGRGPDDVSARIDDWLAPRRALIQPRALPAARPQRTVGR